MTRFVVPGALALLFLGACGGSEMQPSAPTLDIPSTCTAMTNVTVGSIYPNLVAPNCALSGCHVAGAQFPEYGPDANSFRSHVVNTAPSVTRSNLPNLKIIAPGDPNNSFLLYKVTGQQSKFAAGGSQMPDNRPALSAADQCALINWVRSGAN